MHKILVRHDRHALDIAPQHIGYMELFFEDIDIVKEMEFALNECHIRDCTFEFVKTTDDTTAIKAACQNHSSQQMHGGSAQNPCASPKLQQEAATSPC